jgi:hypothetical protein
MVGTGVGCPAKAAEFAAAYARWRKTPAYRELADRFGVGDRLAFDPG